MTPPHLRIGIDARAAAEVPGGRGTVVRELLRALAAGDAQHDFVLFARDRWEDVALDDRFSWRLIPSSDPLWHVRAADRASQLCDVFYSTNSYLTTWFLRIPSVTLVCDLIAFDPALMPQRRSGLIERLTMPPAMHTTQWFLAISQATADDLIARFPSAAGRTEVSLLAASPAFANPVVDRGVLDRHGLARPYVLSVGTLEPRKNLPRLIEAFAALPAAVRDAHDLVLVGATGWDTDHTFAAIARHRDLVRALGHVPEADLPSLYGGAALFAFPSIYEGFGLPVLEAMAAGAPVLTSNTSSMPEVLGDAGILVDPTSVDAIRDGLLRGLSDHDTAARMVAAGRERAATFSWERHAAETLAALESVAAGRR
jgi:glycosyltransferase involved in cell wall biosynthesis